MRVWAAALIAIASALAVSARADDPTAAAREHVRKGTNAFELGSFDEAIREYTEAYRLRDDPAILYDLGQAHRLARHPGEALHFYKMYLAKVPDAPNRAEVEAKIDALRPLAAAQAAGARSPREPRAPSTSLPTASSASPAPATTVSRPAPAPLPPGRVAKVSGVVVGVAGVGLIATGVAFGVMAKNEGDDLTRLAAMHTFDYAKQQAGQRDQTLEAVFLGVGGAALAAGTALYLIGHHLAHRSESRRAALTVTPSIGARVSGATAALRF